MAVPLVPLAGVALRYGAVALIAYGLARRIDRAPVDFRAEEALDDVNEGLAVRRQREQINANTRWHRVIRLGRTGPGFEIDAASITRIRIRKVARV